MTNSVDITNNVSTSNTLMSGNSSEDQSVLGKDDFLKILVTQLSNQDPSNPLQDQDFIGQMANFSSLEQMTNLNDSFDKFANLQMSQYSSAIGKEITWTPEGGDSSSSGVVTGVATQDGSYYYLVGNQKVPMENVTEIDQVSSDSNQ
ncbi:flagellar hook assembly protein FlgD [Pullulanibacillus sp. KACC 23026]|uniref:flagellar hook assembly protein FlgD n=1 Tax=Pullulanibacillus sp. KACC 23026 TaxID=3028315 RepID=UPI0023AFEC69|nr:flagellar hook assembly protein FlgD [Pullulanibacillus sp. KACC 23026]WEG11266.1 flagellar hook assembly protein FlgD [Pullulanibacillus sp. KACC 23026]